MLTLLTDRHLGVFRVLPYKLHLAVHFAVGAVFVTAPLLFGSGVSTRSSTGPTAPPS